SPVFDWLTNSGNVRRSCAALVNVRVGMRLPPLFPGGLRVLHLVIRKSGIVCTIRLEVGVEVDGVVDTEPHLPQEFAAKPQIQWAFSLSRGEDLRATGCIAVGHAHRGSHYEII